LLDVDRADAKGIRQGGERVDERALAGPVVVEVYDERLVVAVDRHAGQSIARAVDEAVGRRRLVSCEGGAPRDGPLDAVCDSPVIHE